MSTPSIMKPTTLLIEITQCQTGYMWYADKIGELFNVVAYTPKCYMLVNSRKIIWTSDCVVKMNL